LLHLLHLNRKVVENITEELRQLMMKKETAETLPLPQFLKWKSKYDAIVDRIIEIEKEQNIPFNTETAEKLIDYMVQYGPGYLTNKQIDFLNENPTLDEKYGMQLFEIERVYNEKRSITELEKEVKKYVEIWKEIIEKSKG